MGAPTPAPLPPVPGASGGYDPNAYNPGAAPPGSTVSTTSTGPQAWFPGQKLPTGHIFGIPLGGVPKYEGRGPVPVDQANLQIYKMSPEDLASFRDDAIRYGYVQKDATFDDLSRLWEYLVGESANYFAAGKHYSPFDIMTMRAKDNPNPNDPNGTGSGTPLISVGSAYEAITNEREQLLNRRYGDGADVTGYRQVAAKESPEQFLLSKYGNEAGSQKALGYYDLIFQQLGGGPQ